MGNYTKLLLCLPAFAGIAAAQEMPRQQLYLGYDMLRASSATHVSAFTMNGAGGQYVFNLNSWVGLVGDVYAVHNANVFGSFTDPRTGITYSGGKSDNTIAFYQFGPRVHLRLWSRVTPFFEMLLGGASFHTSLPTQLANPITIPTAMTGTACPSNTAVCNVQGFGNVRAQTSQNTFAYLLGGGLDIRLSKHVSFRPLEPDLQYTRLQSSRNLLNKSQYHFRYSTGFIFTFGSPQ